LLDAYVAFVGVEIVWIYEHDATPRDQRLLNMRQ
jgi:hypothetical protein